MYHPMVYIRFNPHYFTKDGIHFDTPIDERMEALYDLIVRIWDGSYTKFHREGLSVIYMYYSTETEEDVAERLIDMEGSSALSNLIPSGLSPSTPLESLPVAYRLSCFWECVDRSHPQSNTEQSRVVDIIS